MQAWRAASAAARGSFSMAPLSAMKKPLGPKGTRAGLQALASIAARIVRETVDAVRHAITIAVPVEAVGHAVMVAIAKAPAIVSIAARIAAIAIRRLTAVISRV